MITDEVIDALARIEMHRRDMEKEAGVAAACNEALRKLHELLDHERQAAQPQGQSAGHAANVEALSAEIERLKRLTGAVATPGREPPKRPPAAGPGETHDRPRSKGRRTMGRSGERS